MRYDIVVFGSLLFRRGRSKAWLRHPVDSREYRAIARVFPKRKHVAPDDVSRVIVDLRRASGHDLFQVDEDNGLVNIRGLFTDAAFDARCRQIAALFMCASEHGAEGHVCCLGEGVPIGYGITLGGGEVELIKLDEEQITNASLDPALDAVSDYFKVADPAEPATSGPSVVPTLEKPKRQMLKLPRGAGA
jgi:hypothetical protein